MISPFTKPGTRVIAIEAGKLVRGKKEELLVAGETYTIGWIAPEPLVPSGYGAYLSERASESRYCLRCFRLPVTPEGLLSVPSEAPADLDRRTAPVSPRKRVRA